jgi:predicted O-methyltransferase YrrM
MWYRIKQFLKYVYYSKSIYRIHSPFVYDLVAHVLESKEISKGLLDIFKYRTELSTSNREILFDGFGADKEQKKHTLSHIEKHISLPHKKGLWYAKIIEKYKYQNIVELGTCIGLGSLYLSNVLENKLYTFEANQACIVESNTLFKRFNKSNIEIISGNIDNTSIEFVSKQAKIDMLVMDANHTYEATINYFNTFLPALHENSLVVIDDIYWSEDMTKAWNELRNHPKVSLSLDFYRCGFLFFQHNRLEKEHFKVWVND